MRPLKLAVLALAAASAIVAVPGCRPKETGPLMEAIPADYDRQLPPGLLALRKITDLAQIPDFTPACANLAGLKEAIAHSLNYLSKASSQRAFPYGEITHQQAVDSLRAFQALLEAPMSAPQMNQAIRQRFDVYTSVGWDDRGTVLFTGYYTPIFDGSLAAEGRFNQPLYKPPADLVKGPDGEILGARGADGQLTKLPDRRAIEQAGMYRGNELAYLGDPFEVYIAHVQGSARLRLADGTMRTVGYTANNGHDYVSVNRELVRDGKIPKDKISLGAMIDYFRAHPEQVRPYTWRNPRFVFFAFSDDESPRGSLNEPVTVMRTIATDKSIYPRACLAMLAAPLPRRTQAGIVLSSYSGFALDQDTGGAIRAPGRCDLYMGIGDEAGELAGRTVQPGRLYYLFLKPGARSPAVLPQATQPSAPPQD